MSISGIPSTGFAKPFADSQSLQEIYALLFIAWSMVKIESTTSSGNLENNITWRFYDAIVTEKSRLTDDGTRQYSYSFHTGESVIDNGQQVGITDIQIQFGTDERRRFAIEAKLLNTPKGTNVNTYIGKDGMGRFISGKKYGIGASKGGMVGYVMDGDIDRARKRVTEKIEAKHLTLGMPSTATLTDSTIRENVYETSHIRQTGTPFTIYHIFLSVYL